MKKLTKILPIISLALSLVLCFVVSFINSSGDIITQYHSSYFLVKDGWWAFLIFLPICLLSLALGLKQKDRIAIAISLVISLVLVIGSVAFAQQVKKYSFDKIYLSDIETKTDLNFPKEASIIVWNKNDTQRVDDKTILYIDEGAIWFDNEYDYANEVKDDSRWENEIPENAKRYLSPMFYSSVKNFNYFICEFSENEEMIFMAYSENGNVIYFSRQETGDGSVSPK